MTQVKRIMVVGALALAFPAAAAAGPGAHTSSARPAIAAGNLPGCLEGTLTNPRPLMKSFKATILRVVVSPLYGNDGQALPCIKNARAEGYKVELVVQWNSSWPLSRTKQFFRQILKTYGQSLWAVGVGNEQEITPRLTSAGYVRAWRAIEPILKAITPHAIRVGGEISPWGLSFLKGALRGGLPGIQAVSVHTYRYRWAPKVSQVLSLTRQYHLPLWCDEGLLDGSRSWHASHDVPLSEMRGVAVAGVWDRGT